MTWGIPTHLFLQIHVAMPNKAVSFASYGRQTDDNTRSLQCGVPIRRDG